MFCNLLRGFASKGSASYFRIYQYRRLVGEILRPNRCFVLWIQKYYLLSSRSTATTKPGQRNIRHWAFLNFNPVVVELFSNEIYNPQLFRSVCHIYSLLFQQEPWSSWLFFRTCHSGNVQEQASFALCICRVQFKDILRLQTALSKLQLYYKFILHQHKESKS